MLTSCSRRLLSLRGFLVEWFYSIVAVLIYSLVTFQLIWPTWHLFCFLGLCKKKPSALWIIQNQIMFLSLALRCVWRWMDLDFYLPDCDVFRWWLIIIHSYFYLCRATTGIYEGSFSPQNLYIKIYKKGKWDLSHNINFISCSFKFLTSFEFLTILKIFPVLGDIT